MFWLVTMTAFFVAILFFVRGFKSYRSAQTLRSQICRLELGKSSFAEVSRFFPDYEGNAASAGCSLEGCTYVMYVENPISKAIGIGPRVAFIARVRVYENVLKGRELIIGRSLRHRELSVFVEQSAESKMIEETRIVSYSKAPSVGVLVSPNASAEFAKLTSGFNLGCLVRIIGCEQPSEMLPFLKNQHASPR